MKQLFSGLNRKTGLILVTTVILLGSLGYWVQTGKNSVTTTHPYFKSTVWHIGYCGIAESVTDINQRRQIKEDWRQILEAYNLEYPIVCLVDSFNKPSQSILNNFNVKCLGMRLNLCS